MTISKSTLKQIQNGIVIVFILVIGIFGFVALTGNKPPEAPSKTNITTDPSGKQIIQVNAKTGYTPKLSEAKANTTTILRVSTKSTFDCSTALKIPKLGITKNLPASGDTDIEIAAQPAGTVIDATCSMGMYSFQIKFV